MLRLVIPLAGSWLVAGLDGPGPAASVAAARRRRSGQRGGGGGQGMAESSGDGSPAMVERSGVQEMMVNDGWW